jgi:N-acetylneuraminic acid mutarotase
MYAMGGSGHGYGLHNDVWALNISSNTWTPVSTSGDGPPDGRWGHSAVLDAATNTMIIYGGSGADSGDWALDLSSHTWTSIPTSNDPTQRTVHSAVFDTATNSMYIFGGYGSATLFEVWALSLSSNTWTAVSTSGPTKRWSHSTVLDEATRTAYVFGGHDGSNYLSEVWSLDLSSNTWTSVSTSGDGPPAARNDHSCVLDAATRTMYIMGGSDGNCLNDVWALSLSSHTWTSVSVGMSGDGSPPPGYGNAAVFDATTYTMYTVGGRCTTDQHFGEVWALQIREGITRLPSFLLFVPFVRLFVLLPWVPFLPSSSFFSFFFVFSILLFALPPPPSSPFSLVTLHSTTRPSTNY